MPENIRAIVVLYFVLFFFSKWIKKNNTLISSGLLFIFLHTMILIYGISFLIPNYWVFIVLTFVILRRYTSLTEVDKVCFFFFLLPLLPELIKEIPGFFGIRFIAELTYPRILVMGLLVPIYMKNNRVKTGTPNSSILFLYVLLIFILGTRDNTFTNSLRTSIYLFLDILIPYIVISKSINSEKDIQKIIISIFYSILFIAIVAIFETLKGWHLYYSLSYNLNIMHRIGSYGTRENLLRATGPFSSPISLGYTIVIGFGLGLGITPHFKNKRFFYCSFGILLLALLATLSRGPWVGFFCLIFIYIMSGNKRVVVMVKLIIAIIPVLFFTPVGDKFIGLLPFVSDASVDTHNSGSVSYRQELFRNSLIVIQRNLFFGSVSYMQSPELLSMVQGQGIIDIVNSYIRIALSYGIVGLLLFVSFFCSLIFQLIIRLLRTKVNGRISQLGRALLATIISILIMIATVSSIDTISLMFWSIAAIISKYLIITTKVKVK